MKENLFFGQKPPFFEGLPYLFGHFVFFFRKGPLCARRKRVVVEGLPCFAPRQPEASVFGQKWVVLVSRCDHPLPILGPEIEILTEK